MTPLLGKSILLLLALSLATILTAKPTRHPANGFPAFFFELPDKWIAEGTDSGNAVLTNVTHTTSIVLLIMPPAAELDGVARTAFASTDAKPTQGKQAVEISGCKGFTYFASMQTGDGIKLTVELSLVQVDANHLASITLFQVADVTKADHAAARAFRSGLKLLRAGK